MKIKQSILASVTLLIDEHTDVRTRRTAEHCNELDMMHQQIGRPHQYRALQVKPTPFFSTASSRTRTTE